MKHHDRALERYVERISGDPVNLAVIVTGSVARGTERPDSDVDLYLVVDEPTFAAAREAHQVMYTSTEGVDYDGGYLDIKLATVPYLDAAAERADDPTRASFDRCVIAYSRIDDLAQRVRRIASTPDRVWLSHEASFVAQARLHGEYFLPGAVRDGNRFLAVSAAVHLANAACRALLARHRVLFQGPKYLQKTVASLADAPAGFAQAVGELLDTPGERTGARVLELLESVGGWPVSADETLSLFVEDNELAWFDGGLPPEYR